MVLVIETFSVRSERTDEMYVRLMVLMTLTILYCTNYVTGSVNWKRRNRTLYTASGGPSTNCPDIWTRRTRVC